MWWTIRRDVSKNILEEKPGLLQNIRKAEFSSASFTAASWDQKAGAYFTFDTQDVQVQVGWSKRRTEQTHQSTKWFQVSRITENVPTVPGEPSSVIFKPLTTAMHMPERPGKI